jgi:hypothetical protein
MMTKVKRALVRDSDGLVENVIVIDDEKEYNPSAGYTLVDIIANPGDMWDGDNVIPKPQTTPEPNVQMLLRSINKTFGLSRANELAKEYPSFAEALRWSNWDVARDVVDMGLSDTFLSQNEYDTIVQLMDDFYIPLS